MTPERFKHVAKLIYGQSWQTPLAKALEIDRATIWRWMQKGDIPPQKIARLCVLLTRHIKKLSIERNRI